MGLFKPQWMTDKPGKEARAIEAVRAMEGAAELVRVAREAPLEPVRVAAIERIDDQATLFELAKPDAASSDTLRAAAFDRINDRDMLLSLMDAYRESYLKRASSAHRIMGEAVANAYSRLEHPPFEWNMRGVGKAATQNLLRDIQEMSYPEDREKLVTIARRKAGEPGERAVSSLPYDEERTVLRELAKYGPSPACIAALHKLRLPEDHDVLQRILTEPTFHISLKTHATRMLPDDDPLLDEKCCPYCGALDAVYHHGGYDAAADFYYGAYKCRNCGIENHSYAPFGKPEDFTVTLRDLRNR